MMSGLPSIKIKMNNMELKNDRYRNETVIDVVGYDGVGYIREERIIEGSRWINPEFGLHTIKWSLMIPENKFDEDRKMVCYYTKDLGWLGTGSRRPLKRAPKIEKIFQKIKSE